MSRESGAGSETGRVTESDEEADVDAEGEREVIGLARRCLYLLGSGEKKGLVEG